MEVGRNFSDKAQQDIALVELARKGDESAYSSIMARYRETIYYLILKMVKNQSDAEDLAIETFEKAFGKLDQYSPKYAFSTWLFRIATNHSIDFIRKKRLKTTSIDETMDDGISEKPGVQVEAKTKDPEERIIEKQKITLMRKLVDKLDEPYQSLVRLRYFKELSYDEISEERDIPLGTVKAQLFRARALLATMIKKSKKSI